MIVFTEEKAEDELFDKEEFRRPGEAGRINKAEIPEEKRGEWLEEIVKYYKEHIENYIEHEFSEENVIERYFIDSDYGVNSVWLENPDTWSEFPFDENDGIDYEDAYDHLNQLYKIEELDREDKFIEICISLLEYKKNNDVSNIYVSKNPEEEGSSYNTEININDTPWIGNKPSSDECEYISQRIEEERDREYQYGIDSNELFNATQKESELDIPIYKNYLPDIIIPAQELKEKLDEEFFGIKKSPLKKNISIIQTIKTTSGISTKETEINQNYIKLIKDPVLYGIGNILLNKFNVSPKNKIDIKDIKKFAKTDFSLAQLFSKHSGKLFLQKFSSGFSIPDLVSYDQSLKPMYEKKAIPKILGENFYTINIITEWKSKIQRVFDAKNYVFQINIKPELLPKLYKTLKKQNKNNVERYIKDSNHPTSRDTLTYAWIRYSVPVDGQLSQRFYDLGSNESDSNEKIHKWDGVVLDEIQTDIDDKSFLGDKIMDDWEIITMRAFIKYVRRNLGIQKIYMPSYSVKLDYYNAEPPMHLYKELPNLFGFKKSKEKNGFLLLEKSDIF